jgi:uncharacterized protein YjbI with pentapeptide repeats
MALIILFFLTSSADSITSSVILDQIDRCSPVTLDGVQIEGDLILDGLKPCEECNSSSLKPGEILIDSNFSIRNSTFLGKVSLQGAKFQKSVDMNGNVFLGETSFKGAHFLQNCIFDRSSFSKGADFSGCHFRKLASFESSRLSEASFKDTDFSMDANFGRSTFTGFASFENAVFNKTANFYEAQFLGDAYLRGAKFYGNKARFASAVFNGVASFSETRFNEAIFNEARFASEARFMNANFLGKASFLGTNFEGEALFYKANFSSQIDLTACTFQQLFLHWNVIRDKVKVDANGNIFKNMIDNYKRLGWLADNSECYIDQRHWIMEKKPWMDPSKAADIFLESYCGYGSRPERTLCWIIPVIILFGLTYWKNGGIARIKKPDLESGKVKIMARKEGENAYLIELITPQPERDKSQAKSILRSLWFSFLIFSRRDTRDMHAEGNMEYWIIWERRLGLVLFTIFTYYVGKLIISYFTPSP